MLDGQGCLVPVLRCHRQQLLLEEDKALGLVVPWLLPKLCGTDMVSHLPQLTSTGSALTTATTVAATDSRRKRLRRSKQGKIGHGSTCSASPGHVYGFDETSSSSQEGGSMQFDEEANGRENSDSFRDRAVKAEISASPSDSQYGAKIGRQRKRPRRTRQQSGKFGRNSEYCSTVRVCCNRKEENTLLLQKHGKGDSLPVQKTVKAVGTDSDEENISMNSVEKHASSIINPSNVEGNTSIQSVKNRTNTIATAFDEENISIVTSLNKRAKVMATSAASDEENMSIQMVERLDKTTADASDKEFMAVQSSDKESMSVHAADEESMTIEAFDMEPVALHLKSMDASSCTASPEKSIVSSFHNMAASSSGQPDDAAESQEGETFIPGLNYDLSCRCLAAVPLADRGNLALVAKRFNRLVRSSELFDVRRRCGIVERWVCIYASGDGRWMAFDPNLNKWRNLPTADVNPFFNLSDRESLSAGTHLLWLGREVFDFACYKYDLITNSWERGPTMVNPRCLFASASCGDIAFVAGGFSVGDHGHSRPSILSSAEKYDSRLGKWEPLPPMHTPRQKCSGVYMDGKFFVIGGKDENHDALTSAEAYDPVSKTWKTIPDMYLPQENAASYEPSPPLLAVANNQLYAIDSSTNLLKGYNKGTNTWKVLGPIPVRADFCNGWGLAFKALGDELFVIGGYQASPSPGVAVFSLRPPLDSATPEWTPDAPLPDWKIVNFRVGASGSFLYNCAVMSC